MNNQTICVNKTGRITEGPHDGTVGRVVAADYMRLQVTIENSEGRKITVPWSWVEQFMD